MPPGWSCSIRLSGFSPLLLFVLHNSHRVPGLLHFLLLLFLRSKSSPRYYVCRLIVQSMLSITLISELGPFLLISISQLFICSPILLSCTCALTTQENNPLIHRSNRLEFLAFLLSVCSCPFSNRIIPIEQSLYLLILDTLFCQFYTIVLRIFRTFSRHLSWFGLLHLLRKCDILRLSSKIYTNP